MSFLNIPNSHAGVGPCQRLSRLMPFVLLSAVMALSGLALQRGRRPPAARRSPESAEPWRTLIPPPMPPELFRLGYELPGVKLYILNPGYRLARLGVESDGRLKQVQSLNTLRGLVRISSPEAALRYVRLKTTYPTEMAVSLRDVPGMEIVSTTTLPDLPNFGITGPITRQEAAHWGFSGGQGLLSPEAFLAGGFRRPRLSIVKGGFVVERWLMGTWALQGNGRLPRGAHRLDITVGLAREFVGTDGSYHRRYIQVKKAPSLPRTKWSGIQIM